MSYKFWNSFIDSWKHSPNIVFAPPGGWSNPNVLLNSNSTPLDYSFQYLPEPWWGNSGNHPLHSVVINYNPYTGGGNQFHSLCAPNLFGNKDYSSFVDSEVTGLTSVLSNTNRWHNLRRAQPVFHALCASGIPTVMPKLENHLSIELIPWHTPTPNNPAFYNYISANLQPIFDNSLLFAANESRRISNYKLKNKVILRMNETNMLNLLNQFKNSGICSYNILKSGSVPHPFFPPGSGSYCNFEIIHKSFNDIVFVCIWKPKGGWTRNDFPKQPQLNWIFQNIIK
jgi:hypothetical protein